MKEQMPLKLGVLAVSFGLVMSMAPMVHAAGQTEKPMPKTHTETPMSTKTPMAKPEVTRTTTASAKGEMKHKATIVDAASKAGNFKTFTSAVKAAGLEGTLKGPGPYTVFAPTDEAFAKLPAGTLQTWLKPENKDKLKNILTFHVVSGKVPSTEVMKMKDAKTLEGESLKISTKGGVMVNNAKVIKTDIGADNGVIHGIDKVLMPK